MCVCAVCACACVCVCVCVYVCVYVCLGAGLCGGLGAGLCGGLCGGLRGGLCLGCAQRPSPPKPADRPGALPPPTGAREAAGGDVCLARPGGLHLVPHLRRARGPPLARAHGARLFNDRAAGRFESGYFSPAARSPMPAVIIKQAESRAVS